MAAWTRKSAHGLVACAPHVWQDFEAKLEEESEQASPPQPEPAQAGAPGLAPPSQGDQDDDEDGEQADSSAGAQQAKWEVRSAPLRGAQLLNQKVFEPG